MESALMTAPPSVSASLSASADLPLAVGPAIRMELGLLTGLSIVSCWPDRRMLYYNIIPAAAVKHPCVILRRERSEPRRMATDTESAAILRGPPAAGTSG